MWFLCLPVVGLRMFVSQALTAADIHRLGSEVSSCCLVGMLLYGIGLHCVRVTRVKNELTARD